MIVRVASVNIGGADRGEAMAVSIESLRLVVDVAAGRVDRLRRVARQSRCLNEMPAWA